MKLPAVTPLPADFPERWSGWYPRSPPIGFLLRAAYPDRWLRIHNLPDAKRYATDAGERAEVLRRNLTVAAYFLGSYEAGVRCALLVRAGRGEGPPGLPFAMSLPSSLWAEDAPFASPVALFGGVCVWKKKSFAPFIRAVADGDAAGIVVSLASGRVYAPYDGGADLICANEVERDAAKMRYRGWLSARPDGL